MQRRRVKIVIIVLSLFVIISVIVSSPLFFKDNPTSNGGGSANEQHGQKTMITGMTGIPTHSPTPKSTPTPEVLSAYPMHQRIYATMFWVGEDASEENDYIPNQSSSWDSNWLENFGGIDTPYARVGYYPKAFVPKENPFYVALPYNDLGYDGRKENAASIPWYTTTEDDSYSFAKNRWVKVTYKTQTCYGQWEDVGPFEDDDMEYVFGEKKPHDKRAGIDLSPAMRTCLKMITNGYVNWQFIDESSIPDGPWKKIITTRQVNW
jgi:hypothetical protein